MNEHSIVEQCQRLSRRQCEIKNISRRTWEIVRKTGELPQSKRGPKENELLTTAILKLVKQKPFLSLQNVAFQCGCSKDKVTTVFKQYHLNFLWQRLRYADFNLKELDPDLIKARANPLEIDGPGALVHIDAKQYAYLDGGIKILGITVVDNFSAFASIYLCEDGRKTAENSVLALTKFQQQFPCEIKKVYSDNGTEFVNSKVLAWTETQNLAFRQCKPSHPWSNGKAEVTQRTIKREIILPLLVEKRYSSIVDLQKDVDERMDWYNTQRPHFGRVNKGLVPLMVAEACKDKEYIEREEVLFNLRLAMRWKNRAQWEKTQASNLKSDDEVIENDCPFVPFEYPQEVSDV